VDVNGAGGDNGLRFTQRDPEQLGEPGGHDEILDEPGEDREPAEPANEERYHWAVRTAIWVGGSAVAWAGTAYFVVRLVRMLRW